MTGIVIRRVIEDDGVQFVSYEKTLEQFQKEWQEIIKGLKMSKIEISSGNVYVDLGDSQADEMLVKARLAFKIGEIIKQRQLTQVEAADLLGLTQPKLSGLLRGQLRGVSQSKMLECLNRLGRDAQIAIRKRPRS
jgi:predicted XRE-type DNA-binding protein